MSKKIKTVLTITILLLSGCASVDLPTGSTTKQIGEEKEFMTVTSNNCDQQKISSNPNVRFTCMSGISTKERN